MNDKNKVNADLSGLNDLISALNKEYTLRVGILGSQAKAKHKGSDLTNAEIGTFHEFGGEKMPRRSFLEDSLKFKLDFSREDMKPLKKQIWKLVFVKKKIEQFYQDLGAKCLQIIEEGFATNGFGMWQPLSKRSEQSKINKVKSKKKREIYWTEHNILTDTGQLRRSITFKVFKKKR